MLFDNAAKAERRLQDRIDSAADDLEKENFLGVIGAIEGAEEDIGLIRTCMTLIRDHFPPTTKEEA